jgi:hypothetical protein
MLLDVQRGKWLASSCRTPHRATKPQTSPQKHPQLTAMGLLVRSFSVTAPRDRSRAARSCATTFSAALVSSKGRRGLNGLRWPRVGLLRRELAWLADREAGFDGVRPWTLLARVDGQLAPSRVLPGPLRNSVLLESRLWWSAFRSKEFWRELASELACDR